MSGKRGSNSRPQPWQGCALPTELFPHNFNLLLSFAHPCQGWHLILLGQGCALPTELFPRYFVTRHFRRRSLCESELSHSLARKFRVVFRLTGAKVVQNFKHAKLFEQKIGYFIRIIKNVMHLRHYSPKAASKQTKITYTFISDALEATINSSTVRNSNKDAASRRHYII